MRRQMVRRGASGNAVSTMSLGAGTVIGFLAMRFYLGSRRQSHTMGETHLGTSDHFGVRQVPAVADMMPPGGAGVESLHLVTDGDGNTLDGNAHYKVVSVLGAPESWWSLTLYGAGGSLTPNEEERYAFTSLNAIPEDDATIVIDIAPERPQGAINWLPCRRHESFSMVMHWYRCGADRLEDIEPADLPLVMRVDDPPPRAPVLPRQHTTDRAT